ncbi:hypothetical protein DINM_003284 [Dirofilaria immitis]|nr:hypothetical protein [Dirofilaria immitis]
MSGLSSALGDDKSTETVESPSLNECLYQRLVMLPSLVGITLRNNGDGGCREGIPTSRSPSVLQKCHQILVVGRYTEKTTTENIWRWNIIKESLLSKRQEIKTGPEENTNNKSATILQLELLVVAIGTRIIKFLRQESPVENIADSPADLASGGALSKVLKNSLLWWNDSNWMVHLLERWPRQEIGEEVQEKISEITSATKATIIDAKRFSSLQKLIRTILFVLRFMAKRLRLGEGIGSENPQSEVSLEVIEKWGLVRDTDGIWRSLEIWDRPFGLIWLKDNGTVSKRWVALFTCLVTRAIHMEVSAVTFIQAFRCISRRLRPQFVLSDNAKNFVLASRASACPGDCLWPGYKNLKNSQKYEKLCVNDELNASMVQNKYLEELRKRTLRGHKNPRSFVRRKPIYGKLVLLKGEGSRNSWKMSRAEKLLEEKESHCRSVVVKMSNGMWLEVSTCEKQETEEISGDCGEKSYPRQVCHDQKEIVDN